MDALARNPFGQGNGRLRLRQGLESSVQLDQLAGVETGADAAGIAQLSLRVIIAHEQCAEALPASFGIRIADNHELLAIAAFGFDPAAAAPRPVRLGPPFRDDPFERKVASLAEKLRPATDLVVAVAEHALLVRRNDLGERGFAVLQCRAGQIPAVAVQ